jgi:RHS repeat-associated protein
VVSRTYTEYTWDHRNRLIQVTEGDDFQVASTVNYIYDAFDQLISRTLTLNGTSVQQSVFIHDAGQVALQFDKTGGGNLAAGNLSHRYLWGPAVDQLLADEQVDWSDMDADGEVLWALTDHLGSVRDVVDSNGELRIHRGYDAFGNLAAATHYNATGTVVTAGQLGYVDEVFGFTGRYFDTDTELQNNLHRWYDPAVGRWISEDPIDFAGGDANLSRYVGNQATAFVDRDGMEGEQSIFGQFGLGIAQGGLNIANGVQDAGIGLLNIGLELSPPVRAYEWWYGGDVQILSRDWSRDKLVYESDLTHGISKFVGGEGVITLATAGVAQVRHLRHAGNERLVGEIADRAAAWGRRQGLQPSGVSGSLQHHYAKRLLDRYQLRFGDRGLSTEIRYVNGQLWESGMSCKGSVILDVVEGVKARPTRIFDYKFWNATMDQRRMQKIYSVSGIPSNTPITVVKPNFP